MPGCQCSLEVTMTAGGTLDCHVPVGFRARFRDHVRLDCLTLAVEPVEFIGDFRRRGSHRLRLSSMEPSAAFPIRPPALMRGPIRKPK
jgi:hypothetical protein